MLTEQEKEDFLFASILVLYEKDPEFEKFIRETETETLVKILQKYVDSNTNFYSDRVEELDEKKLKGE